MDGYKNFETEKYLLETLERVAKNRSEYKILYVNISKLKPKNRHPKFVKIITRLFDDLVSIANSTMFVLENGDFAILGDEGNGNKWGCFLSPEIHLAQWS